MFQLKIDEIFKDLSNIFGTADDIITVGYDESSHANMQNTKYQIKQRQMLLQVHEDSFFGEITCRNDRQQDH